MQVLQEYLDKYAGELCYVTEKLDGSSVTCYFKDGEFGVCSRKLNLIEDEKNSLWKCAREMDLENKLRALEMNVALQGEIVGEGIQGNNYKLKGQTVFFFNAFNINQHEFFGFEKFVSLMNSLELKMVPLIDNAYVLDNKIDDIMKRSNFNSTLNNKILAEGIVIRPLIERNDLMGRVSFKAINPEFLLKYEE